MWAGAGFADPGFVFFRGPAPMLAYALGAITHATVGLVLAVRRTSSAHGWLTLAFAIDIALGGLIFGYLPWARQHGVPVETQAWIAWLNTWLTLPLGTLISVWIGLIFPTNRLISTRWLAALGMVALGAVATAAVLALSPGPLLLYPDIVNPLVGPGTGNVLALVLSVALLVTGAPLTGLALMRRYVVADTVGRLQIRWFVTLSLGLEVTFVAFLVAVVALPRDALAGGLILTALFLTGGLPAIALLFAIFRYRLYDIDTIISRTFVYGSLTAILAGIYAASMAFFQKFFTTLMGESSDVALVLTTLLLVTSFTPLKRRLERFVERRFGQGTAAPPPVPLAVLEHPAFTAAIDARIAEALAGRGAPPPASQGEP